MKIYLNKTFRFQSEHALQRHILEYIKINFPQILIVAGLHTRCGGCTRKAISCGYVRGSPDLLLMRRNSQLAIEFKGKQGRLSLDQIETLKRYESIGITAIVSNCDAYIKNEICNFMEQERTELIRYCV
jgi:hypothetical protein